MVLLKVEDQMKLLESSWSELLLLDLLYRQLCHSDTHQLLMVTDHLSHYVEVQLTILQCFDTVG